MGPFRTQRGLSCQPMNEVGSVLGQRLSNAFCAVHLPSLCILAPLHLTAGKDRGIAIVLGVCGIWLTEAANGPAGGTALGGSGRPCRVQCACQGEIEAGAGSVHAGCLPRGAGPLASCWAHGALHCLLSPQFVSLSSSSFNSL